MILLVIFKFAILAMMVIFLVMEVIVPLCQKRRCFPSFRYKDLDDRVVDINEAKYRKDREERVHRMATNGEQSNPEKGD